MKRKKLGSNFNPWNVNLSQMFRELLTFVVRSPREELLWLHCRPRQRMPSWRAVECQRQPAWRRWGSNRNFDEIWKIWRKPASHLPLQRRNRLSMEDKLIRITKLICQQLDQIDSEIGSGEEGSKEGQTISNFRSLPADKMISRKCSISHGSTGSHSFILSSR